MMKITHDKKFNLICIKLTDKKIVNTEEVAGVLAVDLDADGKIVGVELLDTAHIHAADLLEYQDITHQRYAEITNSVTERGGNS